MVRLNTDGASKSEDGVAWCAGVFKGWTSFGLVGFAKYLGHCIPFVTELWDA